MAALNGKWVKLEQEGKGPGARSSHAVALVGDKAYAFGGEFAPRVPVDNQIYAFDLKTLTWSAPETTGDVPPPRVGVTMAAVGKTIYVFGGRDTEHNELNELYAFDTETSQWTLLSSGDAGPANRSYHSTAADDRHVYVFGGCGVDGRLNDLWGYDVVEGKWVGYPSPGEGCKGRGGPGLVVAQGKIWVVYGFAGMEVDDVHCYDPAQKKWAHVDTAGEKPTARSVFSTLGIGKYIVDHQVVMPTVEADVSFGLGKFDLANDEVRRRVAKALDAVGMASYMQRPVQTLSGGQKQRVAIAGALAEACKVLLLDELTTFLDEKDQIGVIKALKNTLDVSDDVTAIWVTHRLEELEYADGALYMEEGKVIKRGDASRIMNFIKAKQASYFQRN